MARFLGGQALALLFEPLSLGNVLVGGDPAASGHRLPRDIDQASISEFVDSARLRGRRQRIQIRKLLLDGAFALVAGQEAARNAMRNNGVVGRPRLQ
jgi:hypothetical protein